MKSIRRIILASGAVMVLAASAANADSIRIVNANILTMDDDNPVAGTLVIEGNRIVSVGQDGWSGDGHDSGATRTINARGKLVIPGIIDQHLHWIRSANTWGYHLHAGENAFTLADLETTIKDRAAEVPAGEWIALIGRHNFKQFLEDPSDPDSGRYPTRQELDAWAPDHKVLFLHRWLPTPVGDSFGDFNRHNSPGPGQMNTAARDFFNNLTPSERVPNVPVIPDDGSLTPFPAGSAEAVYAWTRAHNSLEERLRSTLDLQTWSHSVGLVGAGVPGGLGFRQTQDFEATQELDRRGDLRFRVRYQLGPGAAPGVAGQTAIDRLRNVLGGAPLASIGECIGPAEVAGEGFHLSRVGSPWFRHLGFGEFYTAATPTDMAEGLVFMLRRPDWAFSQHAEAEQIEAVISGFEMGLAMNDPCQIGTLADRHSAVDHLTDATASQLQRLSDLGVGAGIHAVRFLFPDWEFSGPPYRAALDTPGLHVGLGADGMFAGHGNPWTTMQFAVTGETYNGIDILTDDPMGRGPQQITLMEALRAHTRGPAWFSREEHERGQLKAGFLADVVILDQNPFEGDVRKIRDTKAALTIVDGEVVYSNGALDRGRRPPHENDRHDRRGNDQAWKH